MTDRDLIAEGRELSGPDHLVGWQTWLLTNGGALLDKLAEADQLIADIAELVPGEKSARGNVLGAVGDLRAAHDAARARITELEAAHDLARDIARSNSHALNEAQHDLRTARELIDWFTDDEPCDFDHHDGCQAHNHYEPEPGEQCPNETAKSWLAAHQEAEA